MNIQLKMTLIFLQLKILGPILSLIRVKRMNNGTFTELTQLAQCHGIMWSGMLILLITSLFSRLTLAEMTLSGSTKLI